MTLKVFKTIDEQIQILKDRGLTVDDIDFAKDVLIRENYFFINGYRHHFLKKGSDRLYKEGANFKEVHALFNFDRQIRNILFKNLLVVENNMKSIFSYQLSKQYGYRERDYLKTSNFSRKPEKQRQINDLIRKMKRQIRINGGQHHATNHYIKNYGYIPLWVVVKVLSFGIVSELYTIMKETDQDAIADVYGVSKENLITYLPILANYRNICAHEDIIFNHRTLKIIDDNAIHSYLDIPIENGEYIYGKNDILALIIILKQLLADREFRLLISELSYEIDCLAGRLNSVNIKDILNTMGLPVNYKEIIKF